MISEKALDRLFRGTVGYDPLFALLNNASLADSQGYPPYNIEKTGEDTYLVSLALAGIRPDDLSIQVHKGLLTVEHAGDDTATPDRQYLHRGIALRPFRRQFQLAENVEVVDARMEHGLLHVELQRIVPEDQKPRAIPIRRGDTGVSGVGAAKKALLSEG